LPNRTAGGARITRLAEKGVDLKAIAEIAGHASIRTTATYVESNPRRLARILQDVRGERSQRSTNWRPT
jgi:site-specific recombinase XerD